MTILEDANGKIVTDEIKQVAIEEKVDISKIQNSISKGQTVIIKRLNKRPVAVGNLFSTKINVNIGTSTTSVDVNKELEKVRVAEKYGANTISDLSMGGNIDEIRHICR